MASKTVFTGAGVAIAALLTFGTAGSERGTPPGYGGVGTEELRVSHGDMGEVTASTTPGPTTA